MTNGATRFEEIVFIDDFFRSAHNGLHAHVANRRFLAETFGLQARRLGLAWREEFARCDGGALDVAEMMDALLLPHNPAGWARAATADLEPVAKAGLLPHFAAGQLVIGWGLTPSILHAIDRAGASFIDLEIDPIRFAPHLSFCARTNDHAIEATLASWRVDEESFWNEAAILKGYFARRSAQHVVSDRMRVGLFCGQTAVDLALVHGRELVRPVDMCTQVRELAARVDLLLIKPHPYETDLRHLVQLATQVPNATWTHHNIYALLCAENLEFVCALSSGSLREAAYFMKPAVQLIDPDRSNPGMLPASCSAWTTVGPALASLEGLATLCAPTNPPRRGVMRFPEDALDRAFTTRWGLEPGTVGLPATPMLEPGEVYTFGSGRPGMAWLGFGWSVPEGTGVWTDNERASIVLPLAPEADALGPLSLRIEGCLFIGKAPATPLVRAWLNGRRDWIQAAGGGTRHEYAAFSFDIDPVELTGARVLVLEFDITGAQRPCDTGRSTDTRRLGFFLERLSLVPTSTPARADHRRRGVRIGAIRLALGTAVVLAMLGKGFYGAPAEGDGAVPPIAAEAADALPWNQIGHAAANAIGKTREKVHRLLEHGQHHEFGSG